MECTVELKSADAPAGSREKRRYEDVDHAALAAKKFLHEDRDVDVFVGSRTILVFRSDFDDDYSLEVQGPGVWSRWRVIERGDRAERLISGLNSEIR